MSIPADRARLWEEGCTSTRVRRTAAERLTDDLLVEILSRIPARSLCRCKCVSKHWTSLIDHPDHRKKLPQTLAGFFYTSASAERLPQLKLDLHFTNISGSRIPLISPSLSFLPSHRRLDLLDCCNGLILCGLYDVSTTRDDDEFRYIVSNPATEEWVALPESSHAGVVGTSRLGFDPAVSSHFHVFVLLVAGGNQWRPRLIGVDLYSSEIGRWVSKEQGWNQDIRLANGLLPTVFANGCLYFHTFDSQYRRCLATVDTEGERWASFRVPAGGLDHGFIQRSQGRLHYANFHRDRADCAVVRLVIFILEDYDSKEWVFRHGVEASCVLGWMPDFFDLNFHWIAMHPDCNLIFFTPSGATCFSCYSMDRRQVKVIAEIGSSLPQRLPYVPYYSKLQSLNM